MMDRTKETRSQNRDGRFNGALHSPNGEGEYKATTANVATAEKAPAHSPSDHPSSAIEPQPPPFAAEKAWLLDTLKNMGAEKPNVRLVKNATWLCKDRRQTLGRVSLGATLAHDLDAVAHVFDLRAAVMLTIDKRGAPVDALWAIATAVPRIQRAVTRGLLRGEEGDEKPSEWVYRRGCEEVVLWNAERVRVGRPEVAINSKIVAVATKRAFELFKAWEALHQHEAAPPWSKAVGFDVGTQSYSLKRNGKDIEATVAMLGIVNGHRQVQPVLRVMPRKRSAWAAVNRVLSGKYKACAARVIYDRGTWLLKVNYTMPRPAVHAGKGALVIRRGMHRFLTALGSDGRQPRMYDRGEGSGLIAIKRQMHARRGVARAHFEDQGKGSRGHGRARFYRTMSHLKDAEARFVKTWCQQQAACAVKNAVEMGYSEIIIEDFNGSAPPIHSDSFIHKLLRKFPFAQLTDAITWAATKKGITVRKVACDHDPRRCPECGGEEVVREPNEWCECPCGFAAWEDTLVCWNTLLAAGVETTLRQKAAKERAVKQAIDEAAQDIKRPRTRRRRGEFHRTDQKQASQS